MTMETPNDNQNNEKLYAGKFKTVEELEAGYKNSLPTFQENDDLKKKVSELSTIPDDYLKPDDINFDDDRMNDLKSRAKDAGLNQSQFDKLLRSEKSRVEAFTSKYEGAKKEMGEEKANILKDYVTKNYPKELHDQMMDIFILDKAARTAALGHRDQLLNNRVPGMEKTGASHGYTVTQDDLRKAYDAKEKNKGDMKARQHYLNMLDAYSNQQK